MIIVWPFMPKRSRHLTTDVEWDVWMHAASDEAFQLRRLLPTLLRVEVMRGSEKEDGGGTLK
jgi:hypothetical protein